MLRRRSLCLALGLFVPMPTLAQDSTGYVNPSDAGGRMLTFAPDTYPAGLGEPLNVIISANSDKAVLVDSTNNGGLQNYFLSIDYTTECLGQHLGAHQGANLGDGGGTRNETAVIRYDYGNPYTGTCTETANGGGHFRYWIQDGSSANTGAIFMAVSQEKPSSDDHDIIVNGYDLGRDWLVGNATNQTSVIPTLQLALPTAESTNYTTNTTIPASPGYLPTFVGETSYGNYTYRTNLTYVSGLLSNSSVGINHNGTVATSGRSAIDGLVALLVVQIVKTPSSSQHNGAGSAVLQMLVLYISAPLLITLHLISHLI